MASMLVCLLLPGEKILAEARRRTDLGQLLRGDLVLRLLVALGDQLLNQIIQLVLDRSLAARA